MSDIKPRFLQIHTLHSYPAALLNRDDSGMAKRLQYGGTTRTRISSQCLKRHWRVAKGEFSFSDMQGFEASVRSRETINRLVVKPLVDQHGLSDDIKKVLEDGFNTGVYGKKGTDAKGRQALLLGRPEIDYLRAQAESLLQEHGADHKALSKAIDAFFKETKKNIGTLRENTQLPGGLAAALFGRMVTADTSANIDAAIHVAHAFTIHAEESESDYFSVVDDLQNPDDEEEAGAAHIGDTELTAGLFYGYVVVDLPALVSNTAGVDIDDWHNDDVDRSLASEIVRRLIPLIATVTPGAKLGSTAPYSWASFLMVEASARQPRSLAEAFRTPAKARLGAGIQSINNQLEKFDSIYGQAETRRFLSTESQPVEGAEQLNLQGLSDWAGQLVIDGSTSS